MREYQLPVTTRYERLMELLDSEKSTIVKYREELLGSGTIFKSPDLYSQIEVAREIAGSWYEFKKWPIHERAIATAQFYLSNMVDVIKRHDRLQREKMERLNKNN